MHHQCQCRWHGGKWKKSSIRKFFIISFRHFWVVELNMINFFPQVHLKLSAAWYCSHCLPPMSCTGGKFAASVVYTGGNLPPGLLTPLANLPPVSLTLVANFPHRYQQHQRNWWQNFHQCHWYRWCTLTCKYLSEFSKKLEMTLVLFSGLREDDSWKKSEEKNLVTLSL